MAIACRVMGKLLAYPGQRQIPHHSGHTLDLQTGLFFPATGALPVSGSGDIQDGVFQGPTSSYKLILERGGY